MPKLVQSKKNNFFLATVVIGLLLLGSLGYAIPTILGLQSTIASQQTEIDELTAEKESLDDQVLSLESAIDTTQLDASSIEDEHESYKSLMGKYHSNQKVIDTDAASILLAYLDALDHSLSDVEGFQAKVDEFSSQVDTLRGHIESQKKYLSEQSKSFSVLGYDTEKNTDLLDEQLENLADEENALQFIADVFKSTNRKLLWHPEGSPKDYELKGVTYALKLESVDLDEQTATFVVNGERVLDLPAYEIYSLVDGAQLGFFSAAELTNKKRVYLYLGVE